MSEIHIGIGELKVSDSKHDVFNTTLGSCIGIALYDSSRNIGGLAHIMLPKNKEHRSKNLKYADSAIKELLNIMVFRFGAKRDNITAKIVGGANMFKNINKYETAVTHIGAMNIKAVKKNLKANDIKIVASDTGKSYGRTIKFFVNTGKLVIYNSTDITIEL